MYQLQYDPGFTTYEIERRTADGRNPKARRRTSPQVIREAPLLGREDDLTRIVRATEPGGLVVLAGPAGIGKTRLVAEHVRAATTAGGGPMKLYVGVQTQPAMSPPAEIP